MKITEISVNYGETRSVNFQSCRIDIGLSATIDIDSINSIDECQRVLEEKCISLVNAAFVRHFERK